MQTGEGQRGVAISRDVFAGIGAYWLALLLFGWLGHPIPAIGAELDGYVAAADLILAGHLPRDPFRPMLFPMLTAGIGWVIGDVFVATKMISSTAAAACVLAT